MEKLGLERQVLGTPRVGETPIVPVVAFDDSLKYKNGGGSTRHLRLDHLAFPTLTASTLINVH